MGFVYFAAALHPGRLWYFLLIGALSKITGAIWFYAVILEGKVGDQGLFHLIMNDGIWVPFLIAIALKGKAYKAAK